MGIFSAPLLHYPARKALTMLIFGSNEFRWSRHLGIMGFNIAAVWILVRYLVNNLGTLLSYTGIVCGNSLVLILPSLFYLKLCTSPAQLEAFAANGQKIPIHVVGEKRAPNKRRASVVSAVSEFAIPSFGTEKRKFRCKCMAALGVVMLVGSLILQVWKDMRGGH